MDRVKLNYLFIEANALQEPLVKLSRKQKMDKLKNFDNEMESDNISNTLRCLEDDAKGGGLSTSEIMITKGKNCSVLLYQSTTCTQRPRRDNCEGSFNLQ